jgi:hypothetical protein
LTQKTFDFSEKMPLPTSLVYVTLNFTRRTMYYALNLVFPCFIISLMCVFGYWLPEESGEKIGLRIIIYGYI